MSKETSPGVAALAARVLAGGYNPTRAEVASLAASALAQVKAEPDSERGDVPRTNNWDTRPRSGMTEVVYILDQPDRTAFNVMRVFLMEHVPVGIWAGRDNVGLSLYIHPQYQITENAEGRAVIEVQETKT